MLEPSICITWNHSCLVEAPVERPTWPTSLRAPGPLESHSSIPDPHSSGE